MFNPKIYRPRPIEFIDTTLREGLQSPLWADNGKYYPSTKEKIEILNALIKYGVKFIEVFSPNISENEAYDLAILLSARDKVCRHLKKECFILVHARCDPRDVEAALKYKIDGFNFYFGTSNESRKFTHGNSLGEIAKRANSLIKEVRKNYPHLLIRFSGEDAFRTPLNDLFLVYDKISGLVDRFGIPDTVGAATPEMVKRQVSRLKKRYPDIALEGHFHDDRGLSLVNALTAINAGTEYISTSVLGIGERSGITSLTGLIFNLYLGKPDLGEFLEKEFDISSSYPLNVLVAHILGMQVPTKEPISLTNRTHSAGVHTAAMLRGPAYEAHPLEKFGVAEKRLLLGPLSGRHIIAYYLTHIMNFRAVTPEIVEEITEEFKQAASHLKGRQTPTEVLKRIAGKHRLLKERKPLTHIEDLSE